MKIVHVVYSLEIGGAEVLVAQLCRLQRAHGHDVSICAYSQLGVVGEQLLAEGFSIYVPGTAPVPVTMARYLQHFLRLRPDVVHCHNPAPTLQAALPARLAGVGSVISTRHSLVAPPYNVAAERQFSFFAHACDWVAGICEATCINLRGAPWALPERIVRVYNGADPVDALVEPAMDAADVSANEESFTLLFVGRLEEVKDLPTLLRAVAIARVSVPRLRLWIVGDGSVRPQLDALSVELGLTNTVHFWGQQMQTALYYRAVDAFIMSSVSEGLPMSLLQAMSVGLPAVTTDVGGMAEVLRLSGAGLLAPVGNAELLAAQIVRLASDAALRQEFSTRAITGYQQHFTIEQMYQSYLELYRSSNR